MKIDYNILWFEDDASSFNAKKEIVKDIVEELGFNFTEPKNEVNGDNIKTLRLDDFDLIIVDLNLSKVKGSSLIDKIRKMEVYTEVVFYSSSGEKAVRRELKNYEIDGVYCAGRDTEDFEDKVRKVIKTTIKKVQDVNNMRGLVMAETSELDNKMIEIIVTFFDKEKDPKTKKSELVKKTVENREGRLKELKKATATNIEEFCIHNLEASDRLRAISRLIEHSHKEAKKKSFFPHDDTLKNYQEEILDMRNILAHAKESTDKKGQKVLTSIYRNKTVKFTHSKCVKIRKDIVKHSDNLNKIHEIVLKS